ncbi:MAG: hypothetical protein GC160_26615 [Acidobacteria bacterium]|nr:hypothetical protein [Acidobacteriota bacterium]
MRNHPLRRAVVSALLGVVAASGQYFDLSTNGDGSVVYFTTQHARSQSNEPLQGRIYRFVDGRLELFAAREKDMPAPAVPGTLTLSNYYDLRFPSVSSDGGTIAFMGSRLCSGSAACAGVPLQASTIRLPDGGEIEVLGRVTVSPNGRYALREGGSPFVSSGVLNLETGVETETPAIDSAGFARGTRIADDGTLVKADGRIVLYNSGAARALTKSTEEEVSQAVIDAEARTIAYVSRWPTYPETAFTRLRILDIATSESRTLVEGLGEFAEPHISADGARVLFRSTCRFDDSGSVGPPQLFVVETDGSGLVQLTTAAEGVQSAVLSGDGLIAYAVTGLGRLIRIDVESEVETELIPRTVTASSAGLGSTAFAGPSAPGSLASLTGAGLVEEPLPASGFPLPERLGSFRLLLNGQPAPLLSVTPYEVIYQVPSELEGNPPGSAIELRIETSAQDYRSPFQPILVGATLAPALRPSVIPISGEYGSVGGYGFPLSLAADDEYRLVTVANPLSPGDIVHAYATGLGAVEPSVPTGEPAPIDGPVSRAILSFQCGTSWTGVPVLFAGLAPGFVGIYQVSLQIPAGLPRESSVPGVIQVSCRHLDERLYGGSFEFHFPIED